jgi:hypothetical protein
MAAAPRRAYAHLFVPLVLILRCLLHRATAQSRPEGEAALLLQIKHAWGDPPVLAAWSATAASAAGAHCHWPYVECDSSGHVTSLVLGKINVMGPISDAVGGLSLRKLKACLDHI